MQQRENQERQEKYRPAVPITQITARHTMGRILIALADKPEQVCGVARRIGYTGTHDNDLAIYRLKVKESAEANAITLSTLYVVDDGLFVDYTVWQKKRENVAD